MLTLIRNIFSSIGISVMIAELTNTATVMHARLVENVTPFNDALRMPSVTSTLDLATDAGKALLDLVVTQQAVIIAYANDYKMLLILAVAAMPLVLFVGSSKAVQRPGREEVHAMD
jgi:MFS transporter, DHA2 family, multidrug resistance protein